MSYLYVAANMKGDIYINNAIFGGVELLANTGGIFMVKLGRRPAIVTSFVSAAFAMVALCFSQGKHGQPFV